METSSTWMIVLIICLVVIAAIFSAAQTSFTVASRARLAEMERKGIKRAGQVLKLMENPERFYGALLFGNHFANILATVLAAMLAMKHMGAGAAAVATIAMGLGIFVFGEVLPKTIAITYPERLAILLAGASRIISAVLGPIVLGLEFLVKRFLKLLGLGIDDNKNILSARDELRDAIDLHHKEGAVIKKDKDMLGGILDLKDLEVADAMVHRMKMETIDSDMPMADIVMRMLDDAHTRMPVWKETPDNIIGTLHAKNLFTALHRAGGDASKIKLDEILSETWFVPDTRPLEDQLNAFLRRSSHFAIVVDEYGEVQGLITLEDIIEEIVGDIKDEFDAVATGVRKGKDGSFVIEGSLPIRDINRAFDWNLPDAEATTLAGLVIHEARMIPRAGQVFNFHGFRFEIVKKQKQQITSIRVKPTQEPELDVAG